MAAPPDRVSPDAAIVPASPGAATRDINIPRSYFRGEDGSFQRDLTPRELVKVLSGERAGQVWVDIDSSNRHQLALLEKVFHFHPLAIEDTLSRNSRVKLEEYGDYLFMIVRGIRFHDLTPDPYDLETFNLYFFLGPSYLVTVHEEPSRSVAAVAERIDRSPELLSRGVGRLMHAMMDTAIDAYFPIIDQFDAFIDDLEQRVFVRFDQTAVHEIFSLKRAILSMRRHLAPQREMFNLLTNRPSALLTPETQIYFRDVYDHVLRLNDALDTYRELLSSTMDSYLTQVSNRLGSTTKALSVVATISVPFVVVSGMWGMNFRHLPLQDAPNGFLLMLVIQLVFGLGLVGLLHWRRLL